MRSQWFVWLLMAFIGIEKAAACSYPEPPSFAENLKAASSVFIFQLMGTKLIRVTEGTSYYEYIVGDIRPVLDLKGKSKQYKTIRFSSRLCGGHALNTGRFFLVATAADGSEVRLKAADHSILDVGVYFHEDDEELKERWQLLKEVRAALAGEIDPDAIDIQLYDTSAIPLPIYVPPPATQGSENP